MYKYEYGKIPTLQQLGNPPTYYDKKLSEISVIGLDDLTLEELYAKYRQVWLIFVEVRNIDFDAQRDELMIAYFDYCNKPNVRADGRVAARELVDKRTELLYERQKLFKKVLEKAEKRMRKIGGVIDWKILQQKKQSKQTQEWPDEKE